MSEQLTITLDEWVFKDIVENRPENKNRSEWVQELIIKGNEVIKKKVR